MDDARVVQEKREDLQKADLSYRDRDIKGEPILGKDDQTAYPISEVNDVAWSPEEEKKLKVRLDSACRLTGTFTDTGYSTLVEDRPAYGSSACHNVRPNLLWCVALALVLTTSGYLTLDTVDKTVISMAIIYTMKKDLHLVGNQCE